MARVPLNGSTEKAPSASRAAFAIPMANPSHSLCSRLLMHLSSPIRVTVLAEIELLLLTFCTGIQDVTTFSDYRCFASDQTGNTVTLAILVALPNTARHLFITANVGLSLALFQIGAWLTGQLSHVIGSRSRLWLILCNLIQTALVFGAAGVQYAGGLSFEGSGPSGVIILLAFASGSQVVQSRSLTMTEISTAMATAAWVDLVIDPQMWALKNRSRNRRVLFLLALVGGSFAGAFMYRSIGSASTLLVSAVGKLVVTVLFLFNGSENKKLERHIEV